jgi:hypothetical protein
MTHGQETSLEIGCTVQKTIYSATWLVAKGSPVDHHTRWCQGLQPDQRCGCAGMNEVSGQNKLLYAWSYLFFRRYRQNPRRQAAATSTTAPICCIQLEISSTCWICELPQTYGNAGNRAAGQLVRVRVRVSGSDKAMTCESMVITPSPTPVIG